MGLIVGMILALFSLVGSHGLKIPSYITTSSRSDPYPKAEGRRNYQVERKHCATFRTTHANAKRIVCQMKKKEAPDLSSCRNEKADENKQKQSSKRGVIKRGLKALSNVFIGDEKRDDIEIDGRTDSKPNRLDAIRLRLALAMSNINVLPFWKNEWAVACPKTKVGPGQIVPCVVNGLDIIIFASRDGQHLDAFANACPHLGSSFDLATVERRPQVQGKGVAGNGTGDGCVDCIVCPVHRTAFEIRSGTVRGEWCPYPPILGGVMGYMKPQSTLVKFAVRLRGKNVEVRIATSLMNVGKSKEESLGITDIK